MNCVQIASSVILSPYVAPCARPSAGYRIGFWNNKDFKFLARLCMLDNLTVTATFLMTRTISWSIM